MLECMEWLPDDVIELILHHRAAMVVQRAWWRVWHYGHTRRADVWARVCARVSVGWRRRLTRYAHVRREWRSEPQTWEATDETTLRAIAQEAEVDGLWGRHSVRFM